MKIALAACVALTLLSMPAQAEDLEKGKQLFDLKCGMLCHQPPEPSALKPAQWRAVLQTMQTRMKQIGMQPLTQEEHDNVLAYIITQSGKPAEKTP
jgi:cytochrome c2